MDKIKSLLMMSILATSVSLSYAQTLVVAAPLPTTETKVSAKPEVTQQVDLNSATQATLQTIKGIGPARAKAIIDYRNEHGPFKSVDDLLQVKGVSSNFFEKVRDQLMVSDSK